MFGTGSNPRVCSFIFYLKLSSKLSPISSFIGHSHNPLFVGKCYSSIMTTRHFSLQYMNHLAIISFIARKIWISFGKVWNPFGRFWLPFGNIWNSHDKSEYHLEKSEIPLDVSDYYLEISEIHMTNLNIIWKGLKSLWIFLNSTWKRFSFGLWNQRDVILT